jgi:hypothetical protein
MNNMKKRYYRNSNKPLGDSEMKKEEYYNRRGESTIGELNKDLKLIKSSEEKSKERRKMGL